MQALSETWLHIESNLHDHLVISRQSSSYHMPRDGSTATICLIVAGIIYITNVGDSAAYIQFRDGSFLQVSEHHSTENIEEITRCKTAGGTIRVSDHANVSYASCWDCIRGKRKYVQPRLYPGGLLVTRSFGDFYAKMPKLGGMEGVLTHEHGQIRTFKLSKNVKYIVLGSDGIWDALKPGVVFSSLDEFLQHRRNQRKTLPSATSIDALELR
jgi:serine/threonine protein phosphatase PrpC